MTTTCLKTYRRLAIVFGFIALNVLHSIAASAIRRGLGRRKRQIELTTLYSRHILKALGFKMKAASVSLPEGAFIVANHLSYVDILSIASVGPCVFVTSTEMRDTPGLGLICRLGGSLFVNRRRHFVSRKEWAEISQCLLANLRVVVFPEATSSDGSAVLPFKRGLFRAAQNIRARLVSLCINYREFSQSESCDEVKNRICFYGDEQFLPHLLRLASGSAMEISIEGVESRRFEGHEDLRELVPQLRTEISDLFEPLTHDDPVEALSAPLVQRSEEWIQAAI